MQTSEVVVIYRDVALRRYKLQMSTGIYSGTSRCGDFKSSCVIVPDPGQPLLIQSLSGIGPPSLGLAIRIFFRIALGKRELLLVECLLVFVS